VTLPLSILGGGEKMAPVGLVTTTIVAAALVVLSPATADT
jgi:hypothetical protein